VVDRTPASTTCKVGRGRRLEQHGKVGNSIEAHWGGEAHRRGVLDSGGGSAEGLIGARPEERWVAPMVGLEGIRALWWSSGMRRCSNDDST
jgi:hypothetical protein